MIQSHISCFFVIFILVSPSIAPFSFGDKSWNAGDFIQQTCAVTKGDVPLTFLWQLNGMDVSETSGIDTHKVGSRTSLLTIESVKSEHRGNYTCIVKNAVGQEIFTAVLEVNGNEVVSALHGFHIITRLLFSLLQK